VKPLRDGWVVEDESTDEVSADEPPDAGKEGSAKRKQGRVSAAMSKVDSTKEGLSKRAEEERAKRRSVRVAFRLFEEDISRGGRLLSGGLAYRLFLWLLPTALVATSLTRLFSDASGESSEALVEDAGLGQQVAEIVREATEQTGRAAPLLLIVGLFAMLRASRGVLKAVWLVSSIVWRMRPTPMESKVWPPIVTAGILFVFAAHTVLTAPLYRGEIATDIAASLLTIAASTVTVTWCAYKLSHPSGLRLTSFIPGAILFVVGLTLMRLFTAKFLAGRLDQVNDLYGALGFAAVFMGYLYLVARFIVLGLMINPAIRSSETEKVGGVATDR
jgi:membrane protein